MSSSNKFASVHYAEYLQLDKILSAQSLRSKALGEPAHDEMLFIIIHQVYELWFKQILHELESMMAIFDQPVIDERQIGVASQRTERIIEIQKIMIDQIRVLETMTALDFLEFRNYLIPASGFQSFQFRKVEVMMGLKQGQRITYNQKPYGSVFSDSQMKELENLEAGNSLAQLVGQWLERTPFVKLDAFPFLDQYRKAVEEMITAEREAIQETGYIGEEEKQIRLKMLDGTAEFFQQALSGEQDAPDADETLSQSATLAALFIQLYRDEPILRMPYQLLTRLMDMDELFTTWRFRHAQMVKRMLGKKIGTGGSSGHDYLKNTAEKHEVFRDLHRISTLLIPRSALPPLPEEVKKTLGFYAAH
ncbi:MAG: hypothetical protein KDD36_08845 [Flavobacteriales bacterium]|nr:hypothetical protein [Flavobacteriales bacterium]